jgi:hypothetical protein
VIDALLSEPKLADVDLTGTAHAPKSEPPDPVSVTLNSDMLNVIERTIIEQIACHSSCPEGVAVGGGAQRSLPVAPLPANKETSVQREPA